MIKQKKKISDIEINLSKETDKNKKHCLYEKKNNLINIKFSLINLLPAFNNIYNYDTTKENKRKKRKTYFDSISIEEDIQTNEDIKIKKVPKVEKTITKIKNNKIKNKASLILETEEEYSNSYNKKEISDTNSKNLGKIFKHKKKSTKKEKKRLKKLMKILLY